MGCALEEPHAAVSSSASATRLSRPNPTPFRCPAESLAQPKGVQAVPVSIDAQGIIPERLEQVGAAPASMRMLQVQVVA